MSGRLRRAGSWVAVAIVGVLGGVLAVACVPRYVREPPQLPANAVKFQVGYTKAFDRIVQTLQTDGFEIAAADEERGIIETRPRELKASAGPGGPFEYRTVVSIRVGGGWSSSWAVVHVLLVPSYPKEEERVIEQLKQGVTSRSGAP
jgi:hypothetical protein